MSETAEFGDLIRAIVAKSKQQIGWIRSFAAGESCPMLNLFRAIVLLLCHGPRPLQK